MPTIDNLEAAVVAADDDAIPVSQNGATRRVTRAQLLAGVQSSLTLAPGLLGRSATGLGPPQPIAIGGGLTLANGVLSGNPQFSTGAQPAARDATPTDLVPIWQNGQDRAVSVGSLLSTGGVDVSRQLVRGALGGARSLADWLGDAVSVEAFGAVGDGTTDDSAALDRAIASGRPLLLGPRSYRVDGQWTIQSPAVLIGIAGSTTLRRASQRGGAWISVSAPSFIAMDIVFDAGSISGDSWGVLLTPNCVRSRIERCTFTNVSGPTLGCGLTIEARDGLNGLGSNHVLSACTFSNNRCHGVWIQAACGAVVQHCQASNNGSYGICIDFNDPHFLQIVRQAQVVACRCDNNQRGISIGNFNQTNSEPPTWGLENPDAIDVVVSGNNCAGNAAYGIAVSGSRVTVCQNTVTVDRSAVNSSGILCNSSLSTIASNTVTGPASFGIDAGGSSDLDILRNVILGSEVGINAGGSRRVRIADNRIVDSGRAITIFQVETDGHNSNFGLACSDVWITDNIIETGASGYGIVLADGPERIEITGNRVLAATTSSRILQAFTDSVIICRNSLNGAFGAPGSVSDGAASTRIVVSDLLDEVELPATVSKVDSVIGLLQAEMVGSISFVRVISRGVGYSIATVSISGRGSGASASAYIRNGEIIGIALIAGGSGYDSTTTVSIVGDGQGGSASAVVGIPTSEGRHLRLRCNSEIVFSNSASSQSNWTGADITVPSGSIVDITGRLNAWELTYFTSIDHVLPGRDGSVTLAGKVGDLTLKAGSEGGIVVRSASETAGIRVCIGRGSPEGLIVAPPGSDYRNLDGGPGGTFWVKRSGIGSVGWVALA